MIDLHCHVLPAVDDGPATMEESISLARRAREHATTKVVATPHIRDDFPFAVESLPARLSALRAAARAAGVELEFDAAGEVSVSRLPDLDDAELEALCLGSGPYVLVESPYGAGGDDLERGVFDLQTRGFRVVLAHPERSPAFLSAPDALRRLVERGVLCSVTAGSMAGRFGETVRRFTVEMFAAGLVHNVASDAHDATRRPPDLMVGFSALANRVPGVLAAVGWFTGDAPAAILAGADVPSPPRVLGRRRFRLRTRG